MHNKSSKQIPVLRDRSSFTGGGGPLYLGGGSLFFQCNLGEGYYFFNGIKGRAVIFQPKSVPSV